MKLTTSLLLSAALFGFVACSDADKKSTEASTAPAQMTTAPAAGGAVALNPPHGQPNHRCDIEVGQPLNAPAAPNLPMPNLQPLPAAPAQGGTSAGINPPHGEPGHDCAVPVGQPLPAK